MAELPALGPRGEGWVAAQSLLMVAAVFVGLVGPSWPDGTRWWLTATAVLLVAGGLIVVVRAVRALGRGLTPYPRPTRAAALVSEGPYAVVRHPIYSGGILVFAGISLALSPWALAVTALLTVVWALKARVEERFLGARFPAYADYRARVRYRLVPFVY